MKYEQIFLQIGINKEDRNALRLHWLKDLKTMEIIRLWFIRLIFGYALNPFILNDEMTEHLQVCIKKEKNKIVVEETQWFICGWFNIWWGERKRNSKN